MTDPRFLTAARINAGLSKRGLAQAAGVGFATVQRLEAGEGARPENAKKIADLLGCKVTDLMPLDRETA